MGVDEPNITTRDFMETLLIRVEKSLLEQISCIRGDIRELQGSLVTRKEFSSVTDTLRAEIARVEHQDSERNRESKTDLASKVHEMKEDIKYSQQRSLIIIGVVLSITTFIINYLL